MFKPSSDIGLKQSLSIIQSLKLKQQFMWASLL
jgi:hypothetical protein